METVIWLVPLQLGEGSALVTRGQEDRLQSSAPSYTSFPLY